MTEELKGDSEARLEVHVINGGVGESIVIRMPGERWGVVDCYSRDAADPDANPTVQFLRERDVARLEFLCLTHPHDDHYRGMSHLLKLFNPRYFWRSACMTPECLKRIVLHLNADARRRADPAALETANDLTRMFVLLPKMRKSGLQVDLLSGIKSVYPLPQSFSARPPFIEIIGIAPSGNMIEKYQESLNRCFTPAGTLKSELPSLKHNDISIALLIRFGSTSIILGGDVEAENWQATISTLEVADLSAHAVKVSHHGSPTGYTPDLWGHFTLCGMTHAIITPSRRHRLPKPEAIEHIRSHAQHVFTTCIAAMTPSQRYRGAAWEGYSPQVQSALRVEYSQLRSNGSDDLGVCSLSFDSRGNCRDIQLRGGAAELPNDVS